MSICYNWLPAAGSSSFKLSKQIPKHHLCCNMLAPLDTQNQTQTFKVFSNFMKSSCIKCKILLATETKLGIFCEPPWDSPQTDICYHSYYEFTPLWADLIYSAIDISLQSLGIDIDRQLLLSNPKTLLFAWITQDIDPSTFSLNVSQLTNLGNEPKYH